MRLAYVCTDRDLLVPGRGREARQVLANLRALEADGHDVTFFGVGDGARVAGAWRVVRQRAGNGPKELRDHYRGSQRGPVAAEIWSLSVNHRLGRTLEEERQRAPLEGVIERASTWSYAAAAFCHQRRVPYVIEAAKPLWAGWAAWDPQTETAAQAVHAFAVSLARLVVAHDEGLAAAYRALTSTAVTVLGAGSRRQPPPAAPFTVAVARREGAFDDYRTIDSALARLPAGFAEGPLEEASAVVVPATFGVPFDLAAILAADLPVLVPKGHEGDRPTGFSLAAVYLPGDPASLLAAILELSRSAAGRRSRPRSKAVQLARLAAAALAPWPLGDPSRLPPLPTPDPARSSGPDRGFDPGQPR